jgi:hypothetical protein
MRILSLFARAALAFGPSLAAAQQQQAAPQGPTVGPPIRKIATASALSKELLGGINSVVELRDGRVLVNDGTRRRLLAMDTTLTKVEVVLDSLAEVSNTYGTRAGTLIPYRGDSTLFVDPASYAVLVLDPDGRIARVRSIWRPDDAYLYTSPAYGFPATDSRGRIVYRKPARPAPPKVAPPAGVPYIPPEPDSAFIVAIDLDTRKLDTLGAIRIPKSQYSIKQSAAAIYSHTHTLNPLPTTAEWSVLPDGRVAFIRSQDYRIDYFNPDGTWTSSGKLPYEWQHLSDDDKQRLVDSVKNVNQRQFVTIYVASMIRWVNMYNKQYPANFKLPDGYVPPPGLMKDWKLPPGLTLSPKYVYGCPPGVTPTTTTPTTVVRGAAGSPVAARASGPPGPIAGTPSCIPQPVSVAGGNAPPPPTMREINVFPASDLPDYRPPLAGGTARADMDGNLWIRTIPAKPAPGGLIYDIVNPKGELVDRIQLPPAYALVGFGREKVVYLSMRDISGVHLARVRLR